MNFTFSSVTCILLLTFSIYLFWSLSNFQRLFSCDWYSLALYFPGNSAGKEFACNAGDPGLIPGLGRFPGEGIGYPLQYSCLQNSMDRGVWQVIVHGVAELDTTKHSTAIIITICKYMYSVLIKCHILVSAIYICIPFLPPFLRSIHLLPSLRFWFSQPHKAAMLTWGRYIASEWRSQYLNPRDLVSKCEVLTTVFLLPFKKKLQGDGKPSI